MPPVFQVCRNKTPAQGALPPVCRVYVSAMSLTNEVINGENGVMTVVPSNALRQLKNCIAIHQAWKEAEENAQWVDDVPLRQMEWGAVQQWTNCCTDFVPKIMLTGFLTYAEHECKGQFDKPELSVKEQNVEMMKAISTAILDDASSTSTNSFLQ